MDKVVVGFDGSKSALHALGWAAAEAERRGWNVEVVQSWREPLLEGRPWVEIWDDPEGAARQTEADLHTTVGRVAGEHPTVVFHAELSGDRPGPALVHAAKGAAMVVVGARGRGGFARLLLGSVGRRVAAEAPTNVAVVRGGGDPDGDVVVGVDGTASSRRALAWAADEARLRGTRLRVVMAWSYLLPESEDGPVPFRPDYTEADARRALNTIVHGVLGPEPDIELELEATCELAAKALLERADDAALLVVGPRDASLRHRVDLGSVTAQLLQHAPCPVVVVRDDGEHEG